MKLSSAGRHFLRWSVLALLIAALCSSEVAAAERVAASRGSGWVRRPRTTDGGGWTRTRQPETASSGPSGFRIQVPPSGSSRQGSVGQSPQRVYTQPAPQRQQAPQATVRRNAPLGRVTPVVGNAPPSGTFLTDPEEPEFGEYVEVKPAFGSPDDAEMMAEEDNEEDLADEPQEVLGSDGDPGLNAPSQSADDSADEPVAEDTPADRPIDIRDPPSAAELAADAAAADAAASSAAAESAASAASASENSGGRSPATSSSSDSGGEASSKQDQPGKELGTTAPADSPATKPAGGTEEKPTGWQRTPKEPKDEGTWKREDGSKQPSSTNSSSSTKTNNSTITSTLSKPNNPGQGVTTIKPANPYDPNRPGLQNGDLIIQPNPPVGGQREIDPITGKTIEPAAIGIGVAIGGGEPRRNSLPPSKTADGTKIKPTKDAGAAVVEQLNSVARKLELEVQWKQEAGAQFVEQHGPRPTDPSAAQAWDEQRQQAKDSWIRQRQLQELRKKQQ